jgi:hypothetical protein
MNYYYQAGQDKWIKELLVDWKGIKNGSFVDIGCGGEQYSNTLGLEQIGWRGWLVDNSDWAKDDCRKRPSQFIFGDATKIQWPELPPVIDYLSIDVDGATLDALRNFPLSKTKFRLATIEHDSYRFGNGMRDEIRSILFKAGYNLARGDVANPEPFEDWWVNYELFTP